MERLPLLLRPRDVGHRNLLRSPAAVLQPDAALYAAGVPKKVMPAARNNAKLHGRRGIQYPWESGPLHGEEASPDVGHASWYEDHVSLDMAWAFAQYSHATGDPRFAKEDARPFCTGSRTGSEAASPDATVALRSARPWVSPNGSRRPTTTPSPLCLLAWCSPRPSRSPSVTVTVCCRRGVRCSRDSNRRDTPGRASS